MAFEPSVTQLAAINSGITAAKVSVYDSYGSVKQDKLTDIQLKAVNSGIDNDKREKYDLYESEKQDKLTDVQMNAVNSGITALKRQQYDNYSTNKQNTLTAAQLAVLDSGVTIDTVPNLVATINALTTRVAALETENITIKDRITRLEKLIIDGE